MSWLARLKKADTAGASSHPVSPAAVWEDPPKPAMAQAANDPTTSVPPDLEEPPAPAPDLDKPVKRMKYVDWADGWRELDQAYQRHHFGCPQCKAAGRGAGYGVRCGVGAALWRTYSDAAEDRSALDW